MSMIYQMGTAALRQLPAERAHNLSLKLLAAGLGPRADKSAYPMLAAEVGGLSLPNPVGLAPGFDKNAQIYAPILAAGFGFTECGTVTPRPQAGNAKPRLFRLSEDKAVINRMGFNNGGLDAFGENLAPRDKAAGIVGANLGANKDSTDRVADYVTGLNRLWKLADYFTINISSPNTPGLRALQGADALDELLGRLEEARSRLTGDLPSKPLFLKVSPDIVSGDAERITEQARAYGINAIIVSNTTLDRPNSLQSPLAGEAGGLSGAPLMEKSTQLLREFSSASAGRIDLIGVGGIASGLDAYRKIRAGAKAVQLYSALVYKGPQLITEICRDLEELLKADGFSSVAEAVGRA